MVIARHAEIHETPSRNGTSNPRRTNRALAAAQPTLPTLSFSSNNEATFERRPSFSQMSLMPARKSCLSRVGVLLRVVAECNPRQPEPETTQRAVKPFRARNGGKTAISRTPVLPEAILLGPLSAQRRCAYFSTNDQTPFHSADGRLTRK